MPGHPCCIPCKPCLESGDRTLYYCDPAGLLEPSNLRQFDIRFTGIANGTCADCDIFNATVRVPNRQLYLPTCQYGVTWTRPTDPDYFQRCAVFNSADGAVFLDLFLGGLPDLAWPDIGGGMDASDLVVLLGSHDAYGTWWYAFFILATPPRMRCSEIDGLDIPFSHVESHGTVRTCDFTGATCTLSAYCP